MVRKETIIVRPGLGFYLSAFSSMAHVYTVFFLCVFSVLGGAQSVSESCRGPRCFPGQDWRRQCVGAHCQGRTEAAASRAQLHRPVQGQVYPTYQQDGHYGQHQAQSAPLAPYTIVQPGGFGQEVPRRTNPRTITAEVFHPGCAGGTCPTTVSHHPTTGDHDAATRECKGIGCKLPTRMRQKPKPCTGDGCPTHGGDDGRGGSSPVHVTDRAAQFLDELPDFGTERGAFIQLTCDMKPGQ